MKRKRFTEEQIVRILKEAETIGNVRDLCRKHNITEQTFYRWRNKYGGMEVSEAKRVRELERENADLKKLVGELSLDNRMLKDVLGKKVVSLAAKRHAAEYLQMTHRVSERRACKVLSLHRSTKRRQPGDAEHIELVSRIHALSERYPRMGYRKVYDVLKAEDWPVNRETVRLVRKREGLQVVKKQRKRRPLGVSTATPTRAEHPNHVWSYDFVHDETSDGRRLRCLTIIDEYTREGLAIHCARSITSGCVIRLLGTLFARFAAPTCLKSDNGPEFVAQRVRAWLKQRGVGTVYIQPGSPWQNGHNESFNSVFRDGCLDRWLFYSVQEARRVIDAWLHEYNHERPHGALNGLKPAQFAAKTRDLLEQAA